MSAFFHELERHAHDAPQTVDNWLASQRVPHVDGRTVTFVFHGEADSLHLRHWIFGLPSSQAFSRIPGSLLWHLTVDLPENSRVEYKLELVRGQARRLGGNNTATYYVDQGFLPPAGTCSLWVQPVSLPAVSTAAFSSCMPEGR